MAVSHCSNMVAWFEACPPVCASLPSCPTGHATPPWPFCRPSSTPAAFSYETTLYGGNIFALPGLEAWIKCVDGWLGWLAERVQETSHYKAAFHATCYLLCAPPLPPLQLLHPRQGAGAHAVPAERADPAAWRAALCCRPPGRSVGLCGEEKAMSCSMQVLARSQSWQAVRRTLRTSLPFRPAAARRLA